MDFMNHVLIFLSDILMVVMAVLVVYGFCMMTWLQVQAEEERKGGPYDQTAYHTPSER